MPIPSDSPVPALEGGVSDFFKGLWLPMRAVGLVFGTPRLLGLSLLASFITAVTLLGLIPLSWVVANRITGAGVWGGIFGALLAILFLVIGALSLPPLLTAPLQDPLSAATEERCGGDTAPPFSVAATLRGTFLSLRHTLARLVLLLLGFALLLPLNLITGVGSAIYGVLGTLWAMTWLCAEYLSGPMARHLLPFGAVLKAMRRRTFACLGFGAALYVLLWIPILNFFLVPLAVVGGTLLFRAMSERLP